MFSKVHDANNVDGVTVLVFMQVLKHWIVVLDPVQVGVTVVVVDVADVDVDVDVEVPVAVVISLVELFIGLMTP